MISLSSWDLKNKKKSKYPQTYIKNTQQSSGCYAISIETSCSGFVILSMSLTVFLSVSLSPSPSLSVCFSPQPSWRRRITRDLSRPPETRVVRSVLLLLTFAIEEHVDQTKQKRQKCNILFIHTSFHLFFFFLPTVNGFLVFTVMIGMFDISFTAVSIEWFIRC